MAANGNDRAREEWSRTRPHGEFLELCAISTTGELSEEERRRLQEHLAACSECRRALSEFEAVADVAVPLLSSELAAPKPLAWASVPTETGESIPDSSPRNEDSGPDSSVSEEGKAFIFAGRNGSHGTHLNWNYLWMPFAAAVVLTLALGIYSYRTGRSHGLELARATPSGVDAQVDAIERRLSDTGHERELLQTQLAERDRVIRELRRQMENEIAELNGVRNTQAGLERALQSDQSEKQQAAQEKNGLRQNLAVAQVSLGNVQKELDSLREQRQQDQARTDSLTAQIKDLYGQLKEREQTIGKQQDLLAEDRDIRDLMGARDLYIAEVYDVARDGTTRKPYGRVFYTKGKSLVFYAYDLDQQPGVKDASTFQAWGQNGPSQQRALNLGIFYQDSIAKKRWILKFDDPRMLEQINAVFVTVEPHGGSHRPSGKHLLFASLRIEPNHP